MIQKPAITSLASVNGPSVTTRLPADTRMRVPLELGWSPSAPSSTPALVMSALNFLIGRTISGLGTAHSSRACTGRQQHHESHCYVSLWSWVVSYGSGQFSTGWTQALLM